MFHTELKGINYNLVISLNVEKSKKSRIRSAESSIQCGTDVFDKLTELLNTISKSSSEYIECLSNVYESPDFKSLLSRLHANSPHIGFRSEPNSDQESSLRERIKKLTKEKEKMIADHEDVLLKEQDNYDQRVREIIELNHIRLNTVRQELEDKYKLEIFSLKSALAQPVKSEGEQNIPSKSSPENEPFSEIELANESYEATASPASKFNIDLNSEPDGEINQRNQECENHVDLMPNRMETEEDKLTVEKFLGDPELVTDERLLSEERIEKLLAELPPSQADGDSFVSPFPVEYNMIFSDDFWSSERKKDMHMVSKLTKNFLSHDMMKKKLQPQGSFSEFKDYCQKNVFPCWEIRCLIRNKRFPTALHRDAHVKKFHPDGRTIFICNFCHKPQSSEEDLKEHLTTSTCISKKRKR